MMFLSQKLSIALALTMLVALPATAASVSIKAKLTGIQNNSAKRVSILSLNKGSKDGVKTGAKGSATYAGFTDAKGANQVFKAPMALPFTISKPDTSTSNGVAPFPKGLPPIIGSDTPVTIISYTPDKPRKIDLSLPITVPPRNKNKSSQKTGKTTTQLPKKTGKKPSKTTQSTTPIATEPVDNLVSLKTSVLLNTGEQVPIVSFVCALTSRTLSLKPSSQDSCLEKLIPRKGRAFQSNLTG
jgi:hypothetical protein